MSSSFSNISTIENALIDSMMNEEKNSLTDSLLFYIMIILKGSDIHIKLDALSVLSLHSRTVSPLLFSNKK
jgi:hypothetical protein